MKTLTSKYKDNLNLIKKEFGNREDLIVREIKSGKVKFAIIYLLGLTDTENLGKLVIAPILQYQKFTAQNVLQTLQDSVLSFSEIQVEEDLEMMCEEILKGKALILAHNSKSVLLLQADKPKERAIAEPPTNAVIKGPRNGFVENLKTNLSSIKNILRTKELKTINLTVGKYTRTSVAIMYINGIAEKRIVNEIKKKIESINIDGVIDSFYISQFLENYKYSIFKQVGSSEKPDIVCAKMLEGRVAVVVDGSPIVLTLPFIFFEDLQSSNDYYNDRTNVSFVRIIRIVSLLITILLPGMYIAIELHHYKTIPLKYLITIINTTQGLPLTPLLEMIFVLILFEILYEASLRMPRYLGQAMSIVGALILGDTAVKAGIVSPPSVMIVALSSITIYVIPDQAPQFSIIRILFLLAGALQGFYGIILGLLFLILYFNDFDSYGAPYLAPLTPYIKNDMKDYLIKSNLTSMKTRPMSFKNKNRVRQR